MKTPHIHAALIKAWADGAEKMSAFAGWLTDWQTATREQGT